ncbi:hypothetical protein [Agrobacterium tumefaciens]|uniref:hypothetical protein n=1 Tax=Agrobacterium tumefaciens TaxID=358 RepID=UPI0015739C3A|nr:hypothetical protein [Agrobacterium tumefaciens]NSX90102.1 hypothetical protein [Agrobacterium tumefaciens]
MMRDDRPMFPVLNDEIIKNVPWAAVAPHEAQAQTNHMQSLKRLAERGGLGIEELFYVLTDREFPTLISKASTKRDAAYRLEIMRELYRFENKPDTPSTN